MRVYFKSPASFNHSNYFGFTKPCYNILTTFGAILLYAIFIKESTKFYLIKNYSYVDFKYKEKIWQNTRDVHISALKGKEQKNMKIKK